MIDKYALYYSNNKVETAARITAWADDCGRHPCRRASGGFGHVAFNYYSGRTRVGASDGFL